MNSLKVENLDYKYGKFQALKNISFEVSNGVIGILGPNGAGKSTIIKLITTIYQLQKGQIFFNDLNYRKDIQNIRKNIGYLPQDFNVYGNLTGREFLEVITDLKLDTVKEDRIKEIINIIETLNMKDYIDKRIKKYSGGMRQKLGFAQVLIGNPKLIVVDEPTVGLDPEQRNYIRELFPIISTDRIVLVTTHIVEDIENYCNYLLIMDEGRLIYSGRKDNFINNINGLLWEADVSEEEFINITLKSEIVSTQPSENFKYIKYISKEPLTNNSNNVTPTLQEAYIAFNIMNRTTKKND